jgi:DNA-binding response OmpR family regulator/DNA-binding CsgD family transcriptional regulator
MKKTRILIVDDTPENIQAAASILARQGYEIAFAEDGESALEQVTTTTFDLILLDIVMPDMDGYEVCLRLKKNKATSEIPVIFLTVKDDTESIVQGFQTGAADYVTKPFREAELLARVETHMEISRNRKKLEKMVAQRTEALEVVMQIREEISEREGEKIKANIYNRIFPLVETLRESLSQPRQQECLQSITVGLDEILSEFSQKLITSGFDLTPTETQIAGLIREGKSSKHIADQLCVSENTIIFHRQNIRKKLGLTGQGRSLKAFLKSLE